MTKQMIDSKCTVFDKLPHITLHNPHPIVLIVSFDVIIFMSSHVFIFMN